MNLNIQINKQNGIYYAFIGTLQCGSCTFVYSCGEIGCSGLSLCDQVDKPNIITILSLNVLDEFRNKKIGTRLLYEIMCDAYNLGVFKIELDDATDRCHKKNNIYVKAGLYYKYGEQDNSMRGNLRHIFYGKKIFNRDSQI